VYILQPHERVSEVVPVVQVEVDVEVLFESDPTGKSVPKSPADVVIEFGVSYGQAVTVAVNKLPSKCPLQHFQIRDSVVGQP
jgi:hypothetical protein